MDIHQLSVDYLEDQDRILMRINTSQRDELRFWITRRLLQKLWPAFNSVVAEHVIRHEKLYKESKVPVSTLDESQRSMMADFQRSESVRQSDFQTPFNNQPASLPLGEEPLLITEVKLSSLPNGQLRIILSEKLPRSPNPRSCQLDMPNNLTHGLVHLLEQAMARSQWGIGALPAPAAAAEPNLADFKDRPRYLN